MRMEVVDRCLWLVGCDDSCIVLVVSMMMMMMMDRSIRYHTRTQYIKDSMS